MRWSDWEALIATSLQYRGYWLANVLVLRNKVNNVAFASAGLSAFFRASSLEERSHAQQLMNFQATRGGRVRLAALAAPEMDYNHPEKVCAVTVA